MTGLEAAGIALMQALAAQSGTASANAVRRRFAFRARRRERALTYEALDAAVLRARFRVDLLLALHKARQHPLNIPAQWSAFSVIADSLDRTLVDLADVISTWRSVRSVGEREVAAASDSLMLALAELLQHPDPGWYHPIKHRRNGRSMGQAQCEFQVAVTRFGTAARADSAPRSRDRRRARSELDSLPVSHQVAGSE